MLCVVLRKTLVLFVYIRFKVGMLCNLPKSHGRQKVTAMSSTATDALVPNVETTNWTESSTLAVKYWEDKGKAAEVHPDTSPLSVVLDQISCPDEVTRSNLAEALLEMK